jgi:hypothetical protein
MEPTSRWSLARRLLAGAMTASILLAVPALTLVWLGPSAAAFGAADTSLQGVLAFDAPAVTRAAQVAQVEAKSASVPEALAGSDGVIQLDNWQETARHHRHHHAVSSNSIFDPPTTVSDPSTLITTLVGTAGGSTSLIILNTTVGNVSITQIIFDNIFISIIVVNPSTSPFV